MKETKTKYAGYAEIWYCTFCPDPDCGTSNFRRKGNDSDLTGVDVEAVECRKCGLVYRLARRMRYTKSEGQKPVSLFICGHCGKDFRDKPNNVSKIIFAGMANILCFSCESELEDAKRDLAKKYLTTVINHLTHQK